MTASVSGGASKAKAVAAALRVSRTTSALPSLVSAAAKPVDPGRGEAQDHAPPMRRMRARSATLRVGDAERAVALLTMTEKRTPSPSNGMRTAVSMRSPPRSASRKTW